MRTSDAAGQRWVFFVEPSLLFIAFILQLLISLSIPIIKASLLTQCSRQPIELFELHIKTAAVEGPNTGEMRFGLYGFCFLNSYNSGIWDYGVCTAPRIGYTIDSAILSTIGISQTDYALISKALTSFLVVHSLVACMTFLSMVPGFMPFWNPFRVTSLTFNIISAVLSTLVAAVDLAIVIVAQQKLTTLIQQQGDSIAHLGIEVSLSIGVAPWMGLAAAIVLWAAVIVGSILLCDCCFGRMHWSLRGFGAVRQGDFDGEGEDESPVKVSDGEKALARWNACCFGWRAERRRKPRGSKLVVEPPVPEEKKGWLLNRG
ncbi:hypothetical protein M408DRAFT_320236 [Serendipita vermifera MAFF 305830]|uniref:Uncharacterized protein n=1 Tax=Serendipita vermifera MAFF 305830 TaxID=933852 RepID=A0A0C2WYV4_SERVB|nr:hypothetical protein M408DRAFT_320236 [Serendipita vermifera MAFF 305830]